MQNSKMISKRIWTCVYLFLFWPLRVLYDCEAGWRQSFSLTHSQRHVIPDTEKSSNQTLRKPGSSRPAWAPRDPVSDQINQPNIKKEGGQMGGGSLRIALKPLELYNSIQMLILRNRNGQCSCWTVVPIWTSKKGNLYTVAAVPQRLITNTKVPCPSFL